ncbi:hypothetical protein M406DRAFT_68026 [Cryphonectria parasitica EP155]|uniref:Chitin-binding type-1 domain-containing protein n=1 Tax=Cryphonectria parasitica (strain ATCC 38755 / EP155) TaxID=660469 RepID=A0A9P5CNY6_CRYP1|nr:uncharacterized protein M406DRAFT_68026 [Cryphonectria parasitica EP155]KAF3765603.1 hypothetical protein M406DRAFT_68026 [Cryphonectria parasitica EP155]
MFSLTSLLGLLLALLGFQLTSLCSAFPLDSLLQPCHSNGATCGPSLCCSQRGYCGNTSDFCNVQMGCQIGWGNCWTNSSTAASASAAAAAVTTSSLLLPAVSTTEQMYASASNNDGMWPPQAPPSASTTTTASWTEVITVTVGATEASQSATVAVPTTPVPAEFDIPSRSPQLKPIPTTVDMNVQTAASAGKGGH